MTNGSFGGYGHVIGALMIGLIVGGALTYFGATQQISSLERSVTEIREELAKRPEPTPTAPPVKFVLGTALTDRGFRWVGREGQIAGVENPRLQVKAGQEITIEVVNEDGVEHDFAIPALGVLGESVTKKGDRIAVTFVAERAGTIEYICSVPGHKESGMSGQLVIQGVTPAPGEVSPPSGERVVTLEPPKVPDVSEIARSATDLPPPINRTVPERVEFWLETREVVAEMAGNVTYTFWTYNGTVPGPMLRVREGDTVVVHIRNFGKQPHSIDLHAVNGPGGGAAVTQTPPGGETSFSFKALNPGIYIYHCASPHIPTHIANGLYGAILVEPMRGLAPVDREFYVVQGEFYTSGSRGQAGHHNFDIDKAHAEQPEYVVMNGRFAALTGGLAMKAKVGETIRIFFGNGGPNLASSFHVIGEVFDRVYPDGGLGPSARADVNSETILVPAGSATIVEFRLDVPGNYILVDHSIFRAIDKGAVGIIEVEGPENLEIFSPQPPSAG